MTEFVIVYITAKDEKEAEKISKILLEEKLVACINIFPVKSMFWWEGKINDENEFVIIAKTKKNLKYDIENIVKKNHSYKKPCIITINIEGNDEYLKWVENETK